MGANKKVPKLHPPMPPEPPPVPWTARVLRAPAVLSLIWPAALLVGSYVAWHHWGAERIGRQYYRLEREAVSITPPPPFVQSDITAAVFETHQLEKTSLLHRQATATIAQAYQTHPWVQQVVRVEKRSDGVDIHLRYRQPMAMVRVISQHAEVKGPAVFVVDGRGILLPPEDFVGFDTTSLLHIEVPGTYPTGGIGSPFGDQRVIAAAALAELLEKHREICNLAAITLTNPNRAFNESWVYAIIRTDGTRFIWGSAPGEEVRGEPSAAAKLQALLADTSRVDDLRLAKLPAK
ncbi:hypothetical protein [Candidatus Laterigemmans baculatus]|uniref:hypothetical protein n=1 Tax=Candidatus Laterigemmans baculatus TaxID=2770505 RepID=UPI0013DCDF2C|nr:hypothetical protein [Candidatus Laterigemmans baculatus]